MQNKITRQRLFAEAILAYDKAVQLALSTETVEINSGLIDKASSSLHKLERRKSTREGFNRSCRRCGRQNHVEYNCFLKNAKCNNCAEIGHIASVYNNWRPRGPSGTDNCDVAKNNGSKKKDSRQSSKQTSTAKSFLQMESEKPQILEEDGEDETFSCNSELELFNLNLKRYDKLEPPLEISVLVNNIKLCMEVDTGSGMSLIADRDYYK